MLDMKIYDVIYIRAENQQLTAGLVQRLRRQLAQGLG